MSKNVKYAIGVDLGGTTVKAGVVSEEGKLVQKVAIDTLASKGPDVVIEQIIKAIKLVRDSYTIEGIGIGSPGVVSPKKGTVENPPNLPGWGIIHLGKILEKEFKSSVFVENDANVAAIGELVFGAGKKLSNFIMVTLGTGVGGGVVVNGKLFRGSTGGAGEIGHVTIDYNGRKCNCGSVGCIEAYVGNGYMVERVKEELKEHKDSAIYSLLNNDLSKLTPKVISEAAHNGDQYSMSVVKDTGKYLGYGLSSALNLFDITNVIVGGGVAGFGKPLFDSIEETIKSRALKSLGEKAVVLPAKLKNEAGILGASALVFYKS
jgi:glucokinase